MKIAGLAAVLLLACGPVKHEAAGTSGTGSSTGEGGTTGAPTTGVTMTGVTTSSETSEGSASQSGTTERPDFVSHPDIDPAECDLWQQDCPEGQKCVAHGEVDSPTWDAWKCVPVVDDPGGPNEPCATKDAWNSGEDTCEKGSMCWQFDDDLEGICEPFCQGSRAEPSCAGASQYCVLLADDSFSPYLCYPKCDPLAQDCVGGRACLPDFNAGETFTCYPVAADPGALFGACDSLVACAVGLVCMTAGLTAVECEAPDEPCCTAYCDLDAPECPGAGQVCSAWFTDPVPAEYARVGVCVLP